MTVLVLRLAGPLQSWGASSRFSRRTTEPQPTKSGVLGLIAAAQGRRRTDDIEDLMGLQFGVRIDQPGSLVRDFQTARSLDGKDSMPLSYRYYWADAAFLAAVHSDDAQMIESLDAALRNPTFPLYLGRRSCPPTGPVTLGTRDASLREVLANEPWQASSARRKAAGPAVRLEIVRDAEASEGWTESYRDAPLSFDPQRRTYAERGVVRDSAVVTNPDTRSTGKAPDHDPMSTMGGI